MAKYAIDGQDTNTAATTLIGVNAGTTARRQKIYYIESGSDDTPGDKAAEYVLQRYVSPGTSTAITPTPLDQADAAALAASGEAHTVEPIYTANLILLAWMQNQRATYQWFAPPGGELVTPATAQAGAGVQTITVVASAFAAGICVHFEEQ